MVKDSSFGLVLIYNLILTQMKFSLYNDLVLTAIVFSFMPPTGKTYKINVTTIEVSYS